jgi:hypothetical protein
MSKISDIHAALKTLITTALGSGYGQLPNPYAPPENSSLILDQGWGLAIGPGEAVRLEVGCNMHSERQFNIVLTRDIGTSEHDVTLRESAELALVENYYSLRFAMENDVTLGGKCIRLEYLNDSGVEFLATERQRYLSINMTVSALYQESLTA